MSRKSTLLALPAALLLMPIINTVFLLDAHAVTSNLFVSQAVKNVNGKTIQQINAGQDAVVSIRVFNYDATDQPFTAIIDVRDDSDISVHIAWVSAVAKTGSYFDAEIPWTAQISGSYGVRTFVISDFESREVLSRVSSSQLMVTGSPTLSDSFVPSNLTGISKFAISSDGGRYTAWFTLLDKDGKQTTFDGKAKLTITDSLGELRYTKSFSVAENDFSLFKPTEQSAPNIAYVWKLSMLDVDPGLGTGTAVLTFTALDGKIYSATYGPIEIYQASGTQLAQYYESNYNKLASQIDKSIIKENLKVTLVKAGHFTHLANGTFGDEVTHYRADLVVENVGNAINAWPFQYSLVDNKLKEYGELQGGTLHAGDALSGYSKTKGYVLFDDVSEDASWIELVIMSDSLPDEDRDFKFHIDL